VQRIYLDAAATTQVHPDVLAAMEPYFRVRFGNPSSIHHEGRLAREGLETAREQVAALWGCQPGEIIWTSGATEAIHLGLWGLALAARADGRRHLIVSAIEHHAVLETAETLRTFGWDVDTVAPGEDGVLAVDAVMERIRPDTAFVAVMWVNNETGAVQPVTELAARIKTEHPEVRVFSDMVQAVAGVRPSLAHVDAAALSAHKMYGPKGAGALYIRRGTPWRPVLRGGAQERGRRAGTENVAAVVGFGAAAKRLNEGWDQHVMHLARLRDAFWDVLSTIPGVRRNSPPDGAPGILNVAFPGVRSDRLLMRLDLLGIAASSGAACTAGSLEPSHVLMAAGQSEAQAREAVRFSFSEFNTLEEVQRAADIIRQVLAEQR
jgi:cysteine desulfurase